GLRLRPPADPLRPPAPAQLHERRLPDHWHRVRLASSPGYLAQRACPADQLLDAGVADPERQHDCLSPGVLRSSLEQRFSPLQLLRMERQVPRPARHQDHQGGRTAAASPMEAVVRETLRLVVPAGGLILFSAAMLHSSMPNTSGLTRFSMDFRTANAVDGAARRALRGSALRRHLDAGFRARVGSRAHARRYRRPLRRRERKKTASSFTRDAPGRARSPPGPESGWTKLNCFGSTATDSINESVEKTGNEPVRSPAHSPSGLAASSISAPEKED